jgi:hypothetical protein
MALCLCETRYGKFRAVKTYKWKELEQGNPWDGAIAKWETWAGAQLAKFSDEPYTFDNSSSQGVKCEPIQSQFTQVKTDNCYLYNMSRVREEDVNFGIEPEPKKTEPKNAQTPEDEFGPETGPYYAGQDPPGDYWDQSPASWEPTQVGPNCPSTCLQPNGGDVIGMEDDRNTGAPEIWKRDPQVKDHYEEVEVKFWLSWKRQEKIGWDRQCCRGYGVQGLFPYENGWQDAPGGGKFYEPDWSGEPALKIEVPFGLFYQEYHQLIKMRKRHACL